MKIKKKTSLMMLAASTAAVVGVAAVSFAAWTGSVNELSASAATGTATFSGFTAQTNITFDTLVPYDQPTGTYDAGLYKTYSSKLLNSFEVTENYKITVETNTEMSFWFKVGAEVTAAPVKPEDAADTWTLADAGWMKATATGAELYNSATVTDAAVTGYATVSNLYISIILESSSKTEMNKTASFTVKLVQPQVATQTTPTTPVED